MRHGASLLASMEGMSRPAFHIAKELSNNSRSGLTVRFLSKKLEIPQEEIEYLLDVNHQLIFTDITKIKIVAEGHGAIKRVTEGLENRGDVASLIQRVKSLPPHEFRRLEEQLDMDVPCTKKAVADRLVGLHYKNPESIVSYVATRGFSETAREVFDIFWQSKDGVIPVSQVRAAHGGSEYEVEQALWELFRGFALFEMFRFDPEDRLIRVGGLLTELKKYRESKSRGGSKVSKLTSLRSKPEVIHRRGLDLSDTLCKIVAAIAARPVRLRGDGDLFREDRRRLAEIYPEESEPSMSTCLWIAEGVVWLVRQENSLCAGALQSLIQLDRVGRHRQIFEWLTAQGDEKESSHKLFSLLEDMRPGRFYKVSEVLHFAGQHVDEDSLPMLKLVGGDWEYIVPGESGQTKSRLARSLEEAFFWLGLVDFAVVEREEVIRISDLGEALLGNERSPKLQQQFPPRKGEFVVQPNFDIVVPTEDMDPLLTVPMDHFAVRTSTGQATVYNVSKNSFTQAVQEGHDADAFVQFLLDHNRGDGLPPNVMATLKDWRGTMKRVRLRTVEVLETEDPLIMADLVHRRRYNKYFCGLGSGSIVGYEGISKDDLTKALEKDGFVVE
jgi:hypothetical protein